MKIIKEKLDSYESEVPEGVWEEVEARIFPARAPRRVMPWVWAFAAAAALALGVFAGLRLIERGDRQIDTVKDNRITEVTESQTSPDTYPSSSVTNEGGQASSVRNHVVDIIVPEKAVSALAAVTDNVVIDEIPAQVPVEEAVVEDVVVEETPVTEIPVEEKVTVPVKQEEKPVTEFRTDHDGEDWSGPEYIDVIGKDRRSWKKRSPSAGLSLSSAARTASAENILDTKTFFLGVASNFESQTKTGESIFTKTVSTPVNKEEDHARPIRMSLMLDFPLSDVFSLESGLSYSILNSTFTTSSGNRTSEERQMLGYLGIPLNLKANLWDKDIFTVYATGGGMVEKCVTGVSKTVVTVSGTQNGDPVRKTFSVKPLMWSVNAAAGMQLNLPGNLGIYAEPGVSYHFADNSTVSSIYSEKPFDFILSFGARFSFR